MAGTPVLTTHCPVCAVGGTEEILRLVGVPRFQNVLSRSSAEARDAPRGEIALHLCQACGFVFNAAFDAAPLRYAIGYESRQAHSPTFRGYLGALVADLAARHPLRGKRVVEIGCGKADFLRRLCEGGIDSAVGFDPAYVADDGPLPANLVVIPTAYDRTLPAARGDVICARHVIEHIQRPTEFLTSIREALSDRTDALLWLETPRFEWIVDHRAFWDIFYEHCNYFAMPGLCQLVEWSGFAVTLSRSAFGDQYQWLEARLRPPGSAPRPGGGGAVQSWVHRVRAFIRAWPVARAAWTDRLARLARRGPCAVWGGAAKGVTFLNLLSVGIEIVPVVVDINPARQGLYVPGTAQPVIAPAGLRERDVRTILVMNPAYTDEIDRQARAEGLTADVIAV